MHQLRRSALTHDAEDGTGTPMLMARSGHTSVRSPAKYARVSAEALARHQAERGPVRRRNNGADGSLLPVRTTVTENSHRRYYRTV